jgi:flagellar hook assembly protein FlgD
VRTLVDGPIGAGAHSAVWDGTDAEGAAVSSGIYVYELGALGQTLTGRMAIIR